jgi:hypothetical protein
MVLSKVQVRLPLSRGEGTSWISEHEDENSIGNMDIKVI